MKGKPYLVTVYYGSGPLSEPYHTLKRADFVAWSLASQRKVISTVTDTRLGEGGEVIRVYDKRHQ